MSATRQTTIWCDSCSEWDQITGTQASVRKDLKKQGWVYRHGRDLCPQCARVRYDLEEDKEKPR